MCYQTTTDDDDYRERSMDLYGAAALSAPTENCGLVETKTNKAFIGTVIFPIFSVTIVHLTTSYLARDN